MPKNSLDATLSAWIMFWDTLKVIQSLQLLVSHQMRLCSSVVKLSRSSLVGWILPPVWQVLAGGWGNLAGETGPKPFPNFSKIVKKFYFDIVVELSIFYLKWASFTLVKQFKIHGCSNHSNLEMEAEFLRKTLSYLNLNTSRTKNSRNKL